MESLLAQLGLAGEQQQQQQRQQQQRPGRLSQVSPHCPPGAAACAAAGPAVEAAEGGLGAAATPPDQVLPAGITAGVDGVRPTPFFTPAGLSSAVSSPASRRSVPQQAEQASAAGDGTRGGICRTLESSLDEVGSGGSSSRAASRPASSAAQAGSSDDAAALPDADASGAEAAGDEAGPAASQLLGSAVGSPGSSRPGSRQRDRLPDGDDASSEADSFLTACSSTALLTVQQADGPGATPIQHLRSASGTSLGSFSAAGGSPLPAAAAKAAQQQQQQQADADAAGEEAEQPLVALDEADSLPGCSQLPRQEAEAQQPLLDLDDDAPAAPAAPAAPTHSQAAEDVQQPPLLDLAEAAGGSQQQQREQEQAQPPLLDFEVAAGSGQQQQREQVQQQAQPPLLDLAEAMDGSAQQQQQQQQQQPQPLIDISEPAAQGGQPERQQAASGQEQRAGREQPAAAPSAGMGVQIVTRSFSSSSLNASRAGEGGAGDSFADDSVYLRAFGHAPP